MRKKWLENQCSDIDITEPDLFIGTKHQKGVSAFKQRKYSCTLQFDGSSIGLLDGHDINHKYYIQKRSIA